MRSSADKNIPSSLLSGGDVGDVRYFPSNPGLPWLPCDHADYSQAVYQALFAKVGHKFAEGYKGYPTRTVGYSYNGGSNALGLKIAGNCGTPAQPRLIVHHHNSGAGVALKTQISDDGGKTWAVGGTVPGHASYTSYYCNMAYFDHLKAWIISAYADQGSYNYVFRKHISYDNGASWGAAITGLTMLREQGTGEPFENAHICYTGQQLINAGMADYNTNRRIEKSTDGGATWTAALTEAASGSNTFINAASDGAGRVVVIRQGSGVIPRVSTDHGNTWGAEGTAIGGYTTAMKNVILFALGKFWVVANNNMVYSSLDGVTWAWTGVIPTGKPGTRIFRSWLWNGERFLATSTSNTDDGCWLATSTDGIHWTLLQFNNTTAEADRYVVSPAWVPGTGRMGGKIYAGNYDWVYFEDPVIAANKFRVPLLSAGHYIRAA